MGNNRRISSNGEGQSRIRKNSNDMKLNLVEQSRQRSGSFENEKSKGIKKIETSIQNQKTFGTSAFGILLNSIVAITVLTVLFGGIYFYFLYEIQPGEKLANEE